MKKRYCLLFITLFSLVLSACASSGTTPNESGAVFPTEDAATDSAEFTTGDAFGEDYYSVGGETYLEIDENTVKQVSSDPVLTFSLKVDTASYSNVARYIESGALPPADAVRTEELINYFSYDTAMDVSGNDPFAVYTEIGPSPFDQGKHMAFIRVKTEEVDKSRLPSSNLTFLIDTSGSMNSYDKLPLLKEAFALLVETLDEDDTVSIVTYAGSSAVVLDSARGADKTLILNAIYNLDAGGSTAGADGIRTAYELAEKNRMTGGNNRVILASDGDFNVGISNVEGLKKLIGEKRDNGVYLSVLGFGTGNIRDDVMETLSANGNGNYSYINSASSAQKVLVDELGSNLFTVADDVKAQIEFNPGNVKSYRLIGYENRQMSNRDFADDTKDAGEIGVGTDVVMLFELELLNDNGQGLKYSSSQAARELSGGEYGDELFEVRIRYKDPGESESSLMITPVTVDRIATRNSSDFSFACSVAAFGHLLRGSEYLGDATVADARSLAEGNLGRDTGGYRTEYLELLERYASLA